MSIREILMEYETIRNKKIEEAEEKLYKIIDETPEIKKIEDEIVKLDQERRNIVLSSSKSHKNKEKLEEISNKINDLEKQKEKEIQKLNLPSDYFKPQFNCKMCNDTGYITKNSKKVRCNCLKQKILNKRYNSSNIKSLKTENFDTFDEKYYSNNIDEKYDKKISPRENILDIKKISEQFVEEFGDQNPEHKNLLFTGKTGLGKTFISNAIANEILKEGYTVFYQTSAILIDDLIQEKYDNIFNYNDRLNYILNVDLLIIDDFGTEFLNESRLVEVFTIINSRILNNKSTLISTNLSISDISNSYQDRILSRIVGNYTIKRFFGDDIRILKKQEQKKKNYGKQK